jgi:hypothetical protein
MAEILVATGYWPNDVPYELGDVYAVIEILNKRNKTYV